MVEVKSDVSGLVLEILVKKGDQVRKNQALIMLESVKMEISIDAPEAGEVIEIRVKQEDLVEENQIVALLEI